MDFGQRFLPLAVLKQINLLSQIWRYFRNIVLTRRKSKECMCCLGCVVYNTVLAESVLKEKLHNFNSKYKSLEKDNGPAFLEEKKKNQDNLVADLTALLKDAQDERERI